MTRGIANVASLLAFTSSSATILQTRDGETKFLEFMRKHERTYKQGSPEYYERLAVFNKRVEEVETQNAKKDALWTAGINHFSDRTDAERAEVLGYRPNFPKSPQPNAELELAQSKRIFTESMSWRNLTTAGQVPDQGSCGSCWAVTAASVLNAHYEIYNGPGKSFSAQEIVSCVANPQHCGGKGGCDGATVELAMDYVMANGLQDEADFPYEASDKPCHPDQMPVLAQQAMPKGGAALGMTGWIKIPENKEQPLVSALVSHGPVAVSVIAARWFGYSGGIFTDCDVPNHVVDHAVTLYGYGTQGVHKYWLIRNSWGGSWGEDGFIRMQRTDNEESVCGWDKDPQKGTGCDGGPNQVWVCGTCGILYDNVVPLFKRTTSKGAFVASRSSRASQDSGMSSGSGSDDDTNDDSSTRNSSRRIAWRPVATKEGQPMWSTPLSW